MSGQREPTGPENLKHQPGGPDNRQDVGAGGGAGDPSHTPIPPAGGDAYKEVPGHQKRPMTRQETLDTALDDTFPASDPAIPKTIEGVKKG